MKHIAFRLSFPTNGSWNGKDSRADNLFVRVKSFTKERYEEIKHLVGNTYSYRWDDGWSALIHTETVDSKLKAKLLKQSKGFRGYDWMIASILLHGKIIIGGGK